MRAKRKRDGVGMDDGVSFNCCQESVDLVLGPRSISHTLALLLYHFWAVLHSAKKGSTRGHGIARLQFGVPLIALPSDTQQSMMHKLQMHSATNAEEGLDRWESTHFREGREAEKGQKGTNNRVHDRKASATCSRRGCDPRRLYITQSIRAKRAADEASRAEMAEAGEIRLEAPPFLLLDDEPDCDPEPVAEAAEPDPEADPVDEAVPLLRLAAPVLVAAAAADDELEAEAAKLVPCANKKCWLFGSLKIR